MKNDKLRDSDELLDEVHDNSELKFSLTHGATKVGGVITPKVIQKQISSP